MVYRTVARRVGGKREKVTGRTPSHALRPRQARIWLAGFLGGDARADGSRTLRLHAGHPIFRVVSTLAEIERVADELPAPQIEQLFEHLAARFQRERAGTVRKPTNLAEFSGALRLADDPLAWQQRLRTEWQ